MRILLLLSIFLSGITTYNFAQAYEIIDPNLQIRSVTFEPDVYIPEMGTKGVMFIIEYYYSSSSKYLVTFPQEIQAFKYGINVYQDSATYLVMRPNEWNKARKFIPYRKINVPEGAHNDVEVVYQVPGVVNFKGIMKFDQPPRYSVTLDLSAGAAKPRAGNYDTGMPTDWPPDLYWTVTTDDGVFDAYTSKVAVNSFQLPSEKASFFVLEGEKLFLNVFDEDGSEDQKLGKYELSVAVNDFKKEEIGRMFGEVMGLGFNYAQRRMIRQPISTYVRQDFEYMGRKGVQVIFDYFLPQALEGQQMRPSVSYATKDNKKLSIPFSYPLDNSPRLGQSIKLEKQGKISYFIPHYAWNSAIQTIEFAFEGNNGDKAEAAPYFIHNPIEFSKFISYSGYFVEDNYKYLGVSGIKLSLKYSVQEINKYSKVEVNFLKPDKSPIQFDIYPILPNTTTPAAIPSNPHILSDLGEDVVLEYFMPYLDMDVNAIRIELNLVPDISIPIVHETSPKIRIPEKTTDGVVQKLKEEAIFKEGDYGFVVTLNCNVPGFYKDRCLLDIQAKRNGVHFLGYNAVGDMVEQTAIDTFHVVKDSGTIYLIFPYRRLAADDKITVNCQLMEKHRGIGLSESITAEYTLPKNIHNVDAVFNLDAIEFDAATEADSENLVDWKYMVVVGNESKISKTLPKKLKGKEEKLKFSRSVLVNREDLIQIKVVNKKDETQEIFVWSGDLGKFQQSKFKSVISEQAPVKKAKVSATVSKKQMK